MDVVSTTNTLIRILCLHGYGQNGKIFKEKTGSFRKLFKNRAEFSYIDGPHSLNRCDEKDERAWGLRTSDGSWDRKSFDGSFRYFADYYAENGPFDGLLGFSQGAEFASMLCSICDYKFKFVILFAGCKSRVPEHSVYYKNEIKIPSLHVMGETDEIIVKQRSEELRNCFYQNVAETIIHDGGHYVPTKKTMRDKYISFIEKYSADEPDHQH